LVAEQPDLTLDEVVEALDKRGIAGSRSAVWRFFDRRNISFFVTIGWDGLAGTVAQLTPEPLSARRGTRRVMIGG